MRYLSLLLILFGLPTLVMARTPQLDRLDRAAQVRVSLVETTAQFNQAKHEPLRFAIGAKLMADVAAGSWDEPEPGLARWRLRVASSGARSLSFELHDLQLPAGAELWIYDSQGNDVQGPIVAPVPNPLWTPLVRGDEAVVEATMPVAVRDAFSITVAQAFHAYRELSARSMPYDAVSDTGNGASGSCNVDVACGEGDSWHPQIRSSVMLTVGGTTLCSGTLVNNARQDDRPLLLTAHHCGVSDANVGSTIAYFNVQRSACGSGSYGSLTQNIRGKTLLTYARAGSGSDFSLLELASVPPSSFNVYYSGIDISGGVPTSGVGVHHPAGDDKKLSRYSSPASSASKVCIGSNCGLLSTSGFQINAWAVVWSRGVTEGGSSGSALWNQNGELVGTLSGGISQCTSGSSSNGGTDYYARLDSAWTQQGGGLLTPASLKDVLDPDDSGCARFSGKNPGSASALNCKSTPTSGDSGGGTTTPPVPESLSGEGGGGSAGLLFVPVLLLAGWSRRRRARLLS